MAIACHAPCAISHPWNLAERGLLAVTATLLASATYVLVEKPARRLQREAPSRRVIISGVSCSVLLMATISVASKLQPPTSNAQMLSLNERPEIPEYCHRDLWSGDSSLPPRECGDIDAPAVVIWGDSHAYAWQPFAQEVATQLNGRAISLSMGSCPPAIDYLLSTPKDTEACSAFNSNAIQFITEHRPRLLILSARWPMHLGSAEDRNPRVHYFTAEGRDSLLSGVPRAIASVHDSVQEIVILGPIPQLRDLAPRCVTSQRSNRCTDSRASFERIAEPARAFLGRVAKEFPDVRIIEPASFFCDNSSCNVTRDGYMLYWDDDHVSASAAKAFAQQWLKTDDARHLLDGIVIEHK